MKISGILAIAVMLPVITVPALYAGAGADAAAFLKIDAGARAAAMGGAFTAVGDDASSVFYNPAGPALARNQELMLSHSEWLEGLRNEHAAYIQPVSPRLTLFTGLTALIIPSLDKLDIYGSQAGSFSAMDGAAGAGLSWAFSRNFFGGLFAKTVYQQADSQKAFAYAGDFGLLKTYGNTVRLGLSAQNLGTRMKLYSESFDLPLTYRGGAAYRVQEMAWLTAEVVKAGQSDTAFAAGAEAEYLFGFKEKVFARLGYKTGRSTNAGSGISAGVGLQSDDLRVDYAFSPFGDLGDTHRISLTLKFGEDRDAIAPDRKNKKARRAAKTPPQTQKRGSQDNDRNPVRQETKGKDKKAAPGGNEEKPVYFIW